MHIRAKSRWWSGAISHHVCGANGVAQRSHTRVQRLLLFVGWFFGFDFWIFEFYAWLALELRTAVRERGRFVGLVGVQFAAFVGNWQWAAVFDRLQKATTNREKGSTIDGQSIAHAVNVIVAAGVAVTTIVRFITCYLVPGRMWSGHRTVSSPMTLSAGR